MDPQKWCGHSRVNGYVTTHIGMARIGAAALVSILLTVGVGNAQGIPGLPIPPPLPTLPDTPQAIPPVLPKNDTSPPPVAPRHQDLTPPIRISVKDIVLHGNTVFTTEQLRAVTEPFIRKQELTTEDIESLRLALTRYYVDRGYATSGAIVPDQELADNVLTVQIIEGRLAKIEVEDHYWFREPYIRWRVERGAGPPVNVLALQEQLQLLQLDPRFTRLNANLKPGLALGESHLDLRVTEANPFKARIGFNNYLSPTVGAEQGFLNLEHQNVTGFGDQLSVYAAGSSGAHPVITVGYSIPIHPSDTTLSFQYRRFAFAVQSEAFKALDIENRAEGYRSGCVNRSCARCVMSWRFRLQVSTRRTGRSSWVNRLNLRPAPQTVSFAYRYYALARNISIARSRRSWPFYRGSRSALGMSSVPAPVAQLPAQLMGGSFHGWVKRSGCGSWSSCGLRCSPALPHN